MAQELYDYLLNVKMRPNKTAVLLAIPMYMYRIQTCSLEYGINFFQKAVLMFKTKPGIGNDTIAACLGLDNKLVDIVVDQLKSYKLIDRFGCLTPKGKEMKNDIDGLIVNDNSKSIGYIFQHVDDGRLYSYYVSNIDKATVLKGEICTGTKGDSGDEDFYTAPIMSKKLLEQRKNNYVPNEREILSLIRRSNKHAYSNTDIEELHLDTKQYGITYVPDNTPSVVWVCMYAYVPRNEDGIYASEWEILDPFGFDNNSELKLYVESLLTKGLIKDFTSNFRDLQTISGQTIDAYQNMMHDLVEKELASKFDIGYYNLDPNILDYLWLVVKHYLMLQRDFEHTSDGLIRPGKLGYDSYKSLIREFQNIFEAIFKLDKENKPSIYKKVRNEFKYEFRLNNRPRTDFWHEQSRTAYIEDLFNFEGLKADFVTERAILNFAKGFSPDTTNSLRHYLLRFLFAHKYDEANPLFDIIKDKVGIIYQAGGSRNKVSHGQTANEKKMVAVRKDEIDDYFNAIRQTINNYITKYHVKKEQTK